MTTAVLEEPTTYVDPPTDEQIEVKAERAGARRTNPLDNCVLVNATFHRWRGQSQMGDEQVTLNGIEVTKRRRTASKWKLMPDEWAKRFNALEGKYRELIGRRSVPFFLTGVYAVPLSVVDDVFSDMTLIREELDRLADEFCSAENYEEMVRTIDSDLEDPELIAEVHAILPDRWKIRKHFVLEWFVVPISFGKNGKMSGADLPGYVREAQEATRKKIEQELNTLFTKPREELSAAIASLSEQLSKDDRRLRGSSLKNVAQAFEKLRSFFFMAEGPLLAKIKQMEKQLEGTLPQTVNSNREDAQSLVQAMNQVNEEIEASIKAKENFGASTRTFEADW